MNSESPNPNPQAAVEATAKLVQVLAPLSPADRKRAISATMIFLGDPTPDISGPGPTATKLEVAADNQGAPEGISAKGVSWMRKAGISPEQLDHLFAIDSAGIEVIASKMPGSSKRQQTVEAYVVCGLRALLQSGEPNFDDKEARAICTKVGCYDLGNHSNHMNALGNLVGGSKETGWKLSNPGLSRAADIVRQLAPAVGAPGN